jgi:hypothetical protein
MRKYSKARKQLLQAAAHKLEVIDKKVDDMILKAVRKRTVVGEYESYTYHGETVIVHIEASAEAKQKALRILVETVHEKEVAEANKLFNNYAHEYIREHKA